MTIYLFINASHHFTEEGREATNNWQKESSESILKNYFKPKNKLLDLNFLKNNSFLAFCDEGTGTYTETVKYYEKVLGKPITNILLCVNCSLLQMKTNDIICFSRNHSKFEREELRYWFYERL